MALPTSSGIYKITCTANKKVYIGSAVDLRRRKNEHFRALRQNRHHSLHLQRAWNKYGEAAFVFEVLEYVLPMSLTAREQFWLNKLKPFGRRGFNIAHEAGSQLGMKHTPETCEKVRQAHLGNKHCLGRKLSEETRRKIAQAHEGRPGHPITEKCRQGLNEGIRARALARTHCPKGHPYEGENLLIVAKKDGRTKRACRTCQNVACLKRYYARRKEKE